MQQGNISMHNFIIDRAHALTLRVIQQERRRLSDPPIRNSLSFVRELLEDGEGLCVLGLNSTFCFSGVKSHIWMYIKPQVIWLLSVSFFWV